MALFCVSTSSSCFSCSGSCSSSFDAILGRLTAFGSSSVEPHTAGFFFLGGLGKQTSKTAQRGGEQARLPPTSEMCTSPTSQSI